MTDKQLAILIRGYVGRIRREIEDALTLLPEEAKQLRKVGLTKTEFTVAPVAPALDGFEEFAQELAGDAEMLERQREN